MVAEQDARCDYGYVAMSDGTRLAYVVWRPRAAGPFPTLLTYSAYANAGHGFEFARRYLEAGYAYLSANVRGTGASEGTYSYYQPVEGADGAELVEWAARQTWSTGDVGMIGSSYGGHTQLAVAAEHPPHLRAIVPMAVEGSEYHDEAVPGGLFNAGLFLTWTFDAQPALARLGVEARAAAGDRECVDTLGRRPSTGAFHEVLEHPLYDDWWRERTLDFVADRVSVPTLFVHSWQDEWIRPNGASRLFNRIGSSHKRLVFQNGAHGMTGHPAVADEQIRWLDRWVKGERNGIDEEPPVRILWEVSAVDDDLASARPAWSTSHASWPPHEQQLIDLHLTTDGRLSRVADLVASTDDARSTYLFPLGTELPGSTEEYALRPHPLGVLSYRTRPLDTDLVILGSPQLTLCFSADRPGLSFLFTLKDLDPDGRELHVQRSVVDASMRTVDESWSTPDEIVQSCAEHDDIAPNQVHHLSLSLSTIGHVLRAGHSLELSVLAPSPIPSPVWAFVPGGPAVVSIHHASPHASVLQLPVLPGERARADAAGMGTLPNQPWRPARREG